MPQRETACHISGPVVTPIDVKRGISFPVRDLLTELTGFHERSWGWALHCCHGSDDLAHDVLQEAYCRVAREAAVFSGRSSLQSWFFGVIRLTALETVRRQRRLAARSVDTLAAETGLVQVDPAQQLHHEERRSQVQALMQHLSPRQRDVLHLVFYHDQSIEEAATVLGISLGSARQHYHRGKLAMRQHWSATGGEHAR